MNSYSYTIIVPFYDEKRGLNLSSKMGERVYDELPKEEQRRAPLAYANEVLFNDGTFKPQIKDSVRGRSVYVINEPSINPNEGLIEILMIIDALRRSDAREIVVFETYIPFLRQDRASGREPITSRLIGDMYLTAGANRVMTFHPHVEQAVMAFGSNCPLEAFPTYKYISERYKEGNGLENTVVCAPDLGAVKVTRRFANSLGLPMVIINKERTGVDTTRVEQLMGDVNGKRVITFDDVIDTGGSSINAHDYLIQNGATEVVICATHLGFNDDRSGLNRREEIVERGIKVIGTDSIPHEFTERELEYFQVYPLAPLIANIITLRSHGESISHFFNS